MNRSMLLVAVAIVMLSACSQPPSATPAQTPATGDQASTDITPAPAPDPTPDPALETPASPITATKTDDNVDKVNEAIESALGDHTKYETAIRKFQQAVNDADKAGVAALVDYPIAVAIDGKDRIIKNPDAFVRDYDKIMTPSIAGAIKAQQYGDLMVNDQGVMFGSGEAWINGICKDNACKQFDVKVVTIQSAPDG